MRSIKIPLHTVNFSEDYWQRVFSHFLTEYENARTPNPDVLCNKEIKFNAFLNHALQLGADFIATGHYANISNEKGTYKLIQAKDNKKDQLYMLHTLTQEDISKTMFPLANLVKSQVREIARENNLPVADNKESQDVCFIQPPLTTPKFLSDNIGEKEGMFVSIHTNEVLGKHSGYYKYTIGQRKGIGIAHKEPLYVAGLNPNENIVYLCYKDDLFSTTTFVENMNWVLPEYSKNDFEAFCKIRYNTSAKKAKIIHLDNNKVKIIFDEPESAVTIGQMAVIYSADNSFLIGGGTIYGVNE